MSDEMKEEQTALTEEEKAQRAEEQANEENVFITMAGLGAIVGVVFPLVMWLLKKEEFSNYTKKFLTDVLNFEIVMLILFVAIGFIPIMGGLISFALFIFNLVVAVQAFKSARNRNSYKFPISFQFIKG